ncbi:DUF4173 domain-containing protein [Myxococcus sp. K15C18031901]|uniref:DUF4153 domain-containing protein n=1 Tax=Myxococcus dinghuensis TaxID=2906761 RepID=UPI0020A7F369|nr:DUF4173 domain-containing protein [Myxococcus dinghuensis]MCP3098230.1 DUF4173 domain-containing protein [Myxococcus dinghuensis]
MSLPPSSLPFEAPPARPAAPAALPRLTRTARQRLAVALGLGALAQLLLDRPRWGVSFPLVMGAFLAALACLGGREAWHRARPNAWLLAPLVGVSGFVAVRASPWLTTLNVLTAGVLVLMLAHFWAAGRVQRLGLWGYPRVVLSSFWRGLFHPLPLVRDSVDMRAAGRLAPRVLPFVRGLLIVVPVLGVFAGLLTSADVAFDAAVGRLWAVDLGQLLGDTVSWTVGMLVFSTACAAVMGHALRRRAVWDAPELGDTEVAPATPRLGLTEALMLVLGVDALFLVFAGFQVAYLFVGAATSPAPGYTYAEYARRGFFELMLVSMLTLGLVMALARWTRRETPVARVAFQVGTSLMVALTLVIVASAVQRMALYEDAYGYTRLRLFTHVFMVALGGVLAWRGVTLWWRPERFAVGAFGLALAAVGVVNVINPDALIVRLNLARDTQEAELDVLYLAGFLSEDAVPELVRARGDARLGAGFERALRERFLVDEDAPTWPEWNLGRWRAHRALESVR